MVVVVVEGGVGKRGPAGYETSPSRPRRGCAGGEKTYSSTRRVSRMHDASSPAAPRGGGGGIGSTDAVEKEDRADGGAVATACAAARAESPAVVGAALARSSGGPAAGALDANAPSPASAGGGS